MSQGCTDSPALPVLPRGSRGQVGVVAPVVVLVPVILAIRVSLSQLWRESRSMKIKHPSGAPISCSHFPNANREPVLHGAPKGVGGREPWVCARLERRTQPGESIPSPASCLHPQPQRMSPYLCHPAKPLAATGGFGRGGHPCSQLQETASGDLHSPAWKTTQQSWGRKGSGVTSRVPPAWDLWRQKR